MGRNLKLILGSAVFIFMFLAIGGYAYLKSREFIMGPRITINSPENGTSFSSALITIEGNAQNISHITLNDSPIFIDSQGRFSEKLLLLPGYNIITLKAEDRFGKKTEKALELVYQMSPVVYPPATSSTPTTTDDI